VAVIRITAETIADRPPDAKGDSPPIVKESKKNGRSFVCGRFLFSLSAIQFNTSYATQTGSGQTLVVRLMVVLAVGVIVFMVGKFR